MTFKFSIKSILYCVLFLLPLCAMAQEEEETLVARLDSLEIKQNALDKLVNQLNKITISALVQGFYQYGQPDASLNVGSKNENKEHGFHRFGIRRGNVKFAYNDGIGTAAVQIEVKEKGVGVRDLYVGLKDPWTKRNQVTVGISKRPFGYEVNLSSNKMESPERATVIQNFFPAERDLGVKLTLRTKQGTPLDFLTLEGGLFSGNGVYIDTDNHKDFIGRLRADKKIGKWGNWGLGFSYYNGGVYNPTTVAYEMSGNRFVKIDKGEVGSFMKREYFGMDAQFSFINAWGTTTLRAEGLIGVQPGTASSSKSLNASERPANLPENALYKRPFIGYYFYLIQNIGTSPFAALLKYDVYDPNTKLAGNEVGVADTYTSSTDLAKSTLGLGALYHFNKHIRLQAYYEFVSNEQSDFVEGYQANRKDNIFTFCMQYAF